jgi:hypothetical protein
LRSVCRALLVLNVLYCALAAAQDGLPGWHMFESVERLDYALRDRDGRAIDVREYLPRGAHLVDRRELRAVITWICEKEPARAPLVLTSPDGETTTLGRAGAADCRFPPRGSRRSD